MLKSLLRFSIRDVLWLTLATGLACGWLVERRERQRSAANDKMQIEKITADYKQELRRIEMDNYAHASFMRQMIDAEISERKERDKPAKNAP